MKWHFTDVDGNDIVITQDRTGGGAPLDVRINGAEPVDETAYHWAVKQLFVEGLDALGRATMHIDNC